ncbi:MAG: glycoside hydrolase N-terminal domain-containing protein [Bacteroidota bacterium]|nr:glycoside hydrolase N-terminal domain-containing protein [Bacteroidota bacterium]
MQVYARAYTESYMPMADLKIIYQNIQDSSRYKRQSNIDSAIATTSFESNGVHYKRTVFANFPGTRLIRIKMKDGKEKDCFQILKDNGINLCVL